MDDLKAKAEKEVRNIIQKGMTTEELKIFMNESPLEWDDLSKMKAYFELQFLLKAQEKLLSIVQELDPECYGELNVEPTRRSFRSKE